MGDEKMDADCECKKDKFHTASPDIEVIRARLCACSAIEARICLAFSIFGNIAEAPHLHFSMNLC